MSGVLANAISKTWRQPALLVLLIASLFGAGVSVWAHIESLMGIDPGSHFKAFWIFQLLLFLLVLPILRELRAKKDPRTCFPLAALDEDLYLCNVGLLRRQFLLFCVLVER